MYAFIHDSQLIWGPIGFNYRLFNSELEELELVNRVLPKDYENVPIYFDEKTFILPVIQIIPPYDVRFQRVGNFEWEIIKENDIPVRVEMNYPIHDKTLDEIKDEYKQKLPPIRKEKENVFIDVEINGTIINISTHINERLSLVSKLIASPEPHNFKFNDGIWMQISTAQLEYIISQIDAKVQEAFDWEYLKIQEIDACTTGEEVYSVVLMEPENQDALSTNN
jgi:hypothetical protein